LHSFPEFKDAGIWSHSVGKDTAKGKTAKKIADEKTAEKTAKETTKNSNKA
jgi:hypothetical protein